MENEDFDRYQNNNYMWILKNGIYYLYPATYKESYKLAKKFAGGIHWGHCSNETIKLMKKAYKVVKILDFNQLKTIIDQISLDLVVT